MARLPTYFISHGGGPWPWIPNMRQMLHTLEVSLANMPAEIGEVPKAICMVSGHWEEDAFTVMTSPHPGMVYDYNGFPPETYKIVYPAPGAPEIALHTADLIKSAGLPVALDAQRGFDHGTFAPAYVMYPQAEVPIYQVSLPTRLFDRIGAFRPRPRPAAPLRDEGIAIVGSGLSYHNLRLFGPGATSSLRRLRRLAWPRRWPRPGKARTDALLHWERQAPYARTCHAQEDHLVPLFAALGAAEEDAATMVYHDANVFGGVTASSYKIG